MIWWKHSFERLSEEYEMTKRKKQALDNLLNTGRISQSTYESFNNEIDEAVAEIERQHRGLLEKMNTKTEELEQQVKTLETLLANFEIQHVAGEIDEEVYQREIDVLSTGLGVARRELDAVREAGNQFSSSIQILTTETAEPQEIEPQSTESVETPSQVEIEVAEETVPPVESEETAETPSQVEIEVAEETVPPVESEETAEETVEHNLPEPPVESVEVSETDSLQSQQETQDTWQPQDTEETEETHETWQETSEITEETEETSQDTEETQSMETVAEGEEDQE